MEEFFFRDVQRRRGKRTFDVFFFFTYFAYAMHDNKKAPFLRISKHLPFRFSHMKFNVEISV